MPTPYKLVDARQPPYSADPTGAADCRAALQSAVDAGGDIVLVGGGAGFSLAGPLVLKTGARLLGVGGATLQCAAGYRGPLVIAGLSGQAGVFDATYRPRIDQTVLDGSCAGTPRYGLATRGLAALLTVGHPLQLGLLNPNGSVDYWAGGGSFTLDVLFQRPAGVTLGNMTPVCGIGDAFGDPQPWALWVSPGAVTFGAGCNEAAYADTGTSPGLWHRWDGACDTTATTFRLTVQLEFSTGRLAMWLNHTPLTVTQVPNYPAAGQESVTGLGFRKAHGLYPFMIGYLLDKMNAQTPGQISDITVCGLRVCRSAVYTWGSNPQTFAVTPGLAVNDANQYFSGAANVVPTGTFVSMLNLVDAPDGNPWARAFTGGQGEGLLFWTPPVNDQNSPSNVTVEGLTLTSAGQPAVILGQHLGVDLNRLTVSGGLQAVGALPLRNSYPLRMRDNDFSGTDCPVCLWQTMASMQNTHMPGAGRDAVRCSDTGVRIENLFVGGIPPYSDTIVCAYAGGDGGAVDLVNAIVDNEGGTSIGGAVIRYFQVGGNARGRVTVDGLSFGPVAAGGYVLDLVGGTNPGGPVRLDVRNVFGTAAGLLRLRNQKAFHGVVDASTIGGSVVVDVTGADASLTVVPVVN